MNSDLLALLSLGRTFKSITPGEDGKIPEKYLPSYVDDVEDLLAVTDTAPSTCSKGDKYYNTSSKKLFSATATNTWGTTGKDPSSGKIYVDITTSFSYRWSGSDLVQIGQNMSNYYTKTEVDTALGLKQATLVSGTNIKTINSVSILGEGDVSVGGAMPFYIVARQGSSANRIGPNAKITLVSLLNEYLKTNIIPRAIITLSSGGACPILTQISTWTSGSRQAIQLMFDGLCFHHSSQTDFNITTRALYSGVSITVYVDATEWTNKIITTVYYASTGDAEYSSISTNGSGLAVLATGSHPAAASDTIIKKDSLPYESSSYLNNIYWYNAPTTYDPQTGKPLYVPTHLYLCERTGVNNNTFRWVDYIERQAVEASFKQLGLEEYNPSATYAQGDYIYWKGVIYQANAAIEQPESEFNASHWDALTYIEYLKIALAA